MSDLEQLDRELKEYLEKEPNLRREERILYLKAIFQKHLDFTKLTHVINYFDMYSVINQAKGQYSNFRLPMKISDHQVEGNELPHFAMVESFIGYLNKMGLLKKLVKFDYKD